MLAATINQLAAEVAAREKLERAVQQASKMPPERWLKWSTVGSAVATLFIAVLALFQWLVIRKQAKDMGEGLIETRKAADAAKKSADALIDSERAWLIDEQLDVQVVEAFLRFKNWGRTPAHSIEVRLAYISTARASLWPIDYEAIEEAPSPARPVAPNATTDTYRIDLKIGPDFDILTNWKHIIGIVRYRDLGDNVRTITMCRSISPNGPPWRATGPPEANRYT
jgi:hypothetical protein